MGYPCRFGYGRNRCQGIFVHGVQHLSRGKRGFKNTGEVYMEREKIENPDENCPICESDDLALVHFDSLPPSKECEECGHAWQS